MSKHPLLAMIGVSALLSPAHAGDVVPYKSDWQTIEALDGSTFKIDPNRIKRNTDGTAELTVYMVEGDTYDPRNLKFLWFDCRGHYRDQTFGISGTLYAPPRSIAGQMSAIACAGARDTRGEEPLNATSPEPKWTDYCKDFSEVACARIRKVVEAKITPSYCKPGFGIVPTSLSHEQLRICYVMPPLRTTTAPAQPQPPQPAPSQPTQSAAFVRVAHARAAAGNCRGLQVIDSAIDDELRQGGFPAGYERTAQGERAFVDYSLTELGREPDNLRNDLSVWCSAMRTTQLNLVEIILATLGYFRPNVAMD